MKYLTLINLGIIISAQFIIFFLMRPDYDYILLICN